jgi:hypothetical protein
MTMKNGHLQTRFNNWILFCAYVLITYFHTNKTYKYDNKITSKVFKNLSGSEKWMFSWLLKYLFPFLSNSQPMQNFWFTKITKKTDENRYVWIEDCFIQEYWILCFLEWFTSRDGEGLWTCLTFDFQMRKLDGNDLLDMFKFQKSIKIDKSLKTDIECMTW